MKLRVGILAMLCCALAARAEERPDKWWRWSAVVLAGAATADAHSSWGRPEVNPLLRSGDGTFRWRGVAIKAAITGGSLLVQHLLIRKAPRAGKYAAAANFAMAGVLTGAAVHNYRQQPIRPSYLLAKP